MKLVILLFLLHLSTSLAQREVYIVYLGEHDGNRTEDEIHDLHHSFVSSVKNDTEEAKAFIIRSYKRVINGFSSLLTPDEAAKISEMDGVLSVFKSEPRKMQTTRSWDFVDELTSYNSYGTLGREELLKQTNYGKDVIVGIVDSGVWPESQSFSDEGMGPIPERWKGTCQPGDYFDSSHCNRKLVGARYYMDGFLQTYGPVNTELDYRSARDSAGHGTHTASTAGGRRVPDVSFPGGLGQGVVSGGAPDVRVAVYKACWQLPFEFSKDFYCLDADLLSAYDDAIADGVDVLSLSIIPFNFKSYQSDGMALGAWHAFKKNVVVVACAGNDGPTPSTVVNVAPWIMSVGASSIDRSFSSPVILGNGTTLEAESLTSTKMNKLYPLIYAGDYEVPGTTNSTTTGQCYPGTLLPEYTKGKIVLCLTAKTFITVKALAVKEAGGIGVIIQSSSGGMGVPAISYLIPGTTVSYNGAYDILDYIRNNRYPTASIAPAKTTLNNKPAPIVAGFSSTGPNGFDHDILKPDIIAPGLSILAAWTEGAGPTDLFADQRVVKYNVEYGTSMATPHVAAAAALVKAVHPDWSSAAIRSALMTTAGQTNNMGELITNQFGNPATPFEMGAGHFQPTKAVDPGLVYDATMKDYIWLFCKEGATFWEGEDCNQYAPYPKSSLANYPSVAAASIYDTFSVERTVTNVGDPNSLYNVYGQSPEGFEVFIDPPRLEFEYVGQQKKFNVNIRRIGSQAGDYAFGWFEWRDGVHFVRSPIVIS